MDIVIIGFGAAGFAAALAAKKTNKDIKISVIDKKDYDLVHPCGLPFYLEGKTKDIDKLKHNLNLDSMNIIKYNNSEVTGIDIDNKEVQFKNLKNNEIKKISYNKLIIAAGSVPFLPAIKGIELAYKIHHTEDVKKLKNEISKIKKAVIIGTGAIGLETAIALKNNGLEVTLIDIMANVLPNLIDEDIAEILEDYLKQEKISLLFNKKIKKIEKNNVVFDDSSIKTNIVIAATGIKPNLGLIKNSIIKTNDLGIVVNEKMQTNVKDVYAAGDCTQQISLINKKPCNVKLATTAYAQGTVAGINAAGGNLAYEGALGAFVSKIGSLEVAATGFNSSNAKKNGYDILVGKAKSFIRPEWFPESKKITLKIIADKKNGKIIGSQAIGEEGAASRINIISAAIKAGFTLNDLVTLELAYCPAVSDIKDALIMAAEFALRKFDK